MSRVQKFPEETGKFSTWLLVKWYVHHTHENFLNRPQCMAMHTLFILTCKRILSDGHCDGKRGEIKLGEETTYKI